MQVHDGADGVAAAGTGCRVFGEHKGFIMVFGTPDQWSASRVYFQRSCMAWEACSLSLPNDHVSCISWLNSSSLLAWHRLFNHVIPELTHATS